jgi:sec-independent protein translocase protein TatA
MFGHIPELMAVLVVGLLIFGPKRVIEMGSAAGKVLRELRSAVKDMNWSTLVADEDGNNPLAELRDLPRTFTAPPPPLPPAATSQTAAPPPSPTVVESAPAPTVEASSPEAPTPTSASTPGQP